MVEDAPKLESVLLAHVLSLFKLVCAVLHLTFKLVVPLTQQLESFYICLHISLVFRKLNDFNLLVTLEVLLQINLVSELVLQTLLHLGLDLRTFFLSVRDQLRHAVVGRH